MKLNKYTQKQLIESVATSNSMRQTLIKLGVAPYGGNYDVLRKALKYFNIDTSHFTGKAWNKGKKHSYKNPLSYYLKEDIQVLSYRLKNRLIEENIFAQICSWCNQTEWLNQPIPLELDHISGNNRDNRLENLRLLCPNCHALTPTYRGKNKARKA